MKIVVENNFNLKMNKLRFKSIKNLKLNNEINSLIVKLIQINKFKMF